MKKFVFASCALLMIAGATSVHAITPVSPEYEYVFVPLSTDDGSSLGSWGGELFLDAPMSTGGSLSDINMGDSFLVTPYGSFYLSQSSQESITAGVPFTWIPTTITSMDITGLGPLSVPDAWEITQTSIGISIPDPTATGVWVAAVPDSSSTVGLIGLAMTGLCGFSYFSRTRRLAVARR